jgi:hypothetical protein
MKLLVKEQIYFVDGHGTPKSGGIKKFITDKQIYKYLKPNVYYRAYEFEYIDIPVINEHTVKEFFEDEDNASIIMNNDDMYASDGYHCTVCTYVVKEITDEAAEEIQYFIEKYNDL